VLLSRSRISTQLRRIDSAEALIVLEVLQELQMDQKQADAEPLRLLAAAAVAEIAMAEM
jgi:hypothetical protein